MMAGEKLTGDVRPYATEVNVISLIDKLYGMKVLSIKRLNGYYDQNFHINVYTTGCENTHIQKPCVSGYVFKILNSKDSLNKAHLSAQVALLNHVRARGVPCPILVKTCSGEVFTEHTIKNKGRDTTAMHVIRMFEYIEGDTVYKVGITDDLLYQGGKLLSKFCSAVQDFNDSGLVKEGNLWNISNVPMLQEYINAVEDPSDKKLIEAIIQKFITLKEDLDKLPDVAVHSDFSEQNLLVVPNETGKQMVVGILDFQESCNGKRCFDLGVNIAYMMVYYKGDVLDVGGYVMRGYLEHDTLSEHELSMVYYCAVGRITQSLVNGIHNYSLYGDPYCLSTSHTGWQALRSLWSKPAAKVLQRWLDIANDKSLQGEC